MVASTKQVTTPPAKTEQPKKRNWVTTVAAFLILQMVAVLFVEGVLYCAGMGEEEIFHFDPEIGFTHMHDKRVTWRTEGFATSWLDHDGMREHNLTLQKPANTYRVAVLGDSMVEGLQVPIEQTFGQIIQRRLSPFNGKQIQFLDFGTSGYSTAQEYMQIKRQVMRYQPDLVIVCYDSRDIFENWSPPDQVVTNVRPYALHLPGGHLVVDSEPVRRWMNSPRAKVMLATDWLRHHSRIAGLLVALDLEWSQHNPWYRAFIDALAHPKKATKEFKEAFASMQKSGPSFQIKFFEDGAHPAANSAAPAATQTASRTINSATGNEALSQNPALQSVGAAPASVTVAVRASVSSANAASVDAKTAGENAYKALITRTLGSLFDEMRKTCNNGGADFAVVGLPVRAQLCPLIGMDTQFAGIDYGQEVAIVESLCKQQNIPFISVEKYAEALDYHQREALFYTAHLTPKGQQFIADAIQPFVREQLAKRKTEQDR